MDFLFDPFDTIDYGNGYIAHGYSSSYKEPIHDAFIEYLNKNWDKVAYDINRVLAEEEDDAVSSLIGRLYVDIIIGSKMLLKM